MDLGLAKNNLRPERLIAQPEMRVGAQTRQDRMWEEAMTTVALALSTVDLLLNSGLVLERDL